MISPYDNFVLGDGLLHWSYSRGRDRQGEQSDEDTNVNYDSNC